MTDSFSTIPLSALLKIILNQYENHGNILGIATGLFFDPEINKKISITRFGKLLESPIGVAAGPQTQLAQNIVTAWLTGARFIELKTIQTLDELEISKPCIDMQNEGYNCEWSQELKINESFEQYLDAWIIIHILRDRFGWENGSDPGVIFNMSVGYNYEGVLKDNVQWFFNKMNDASEELKAKIESIKSVYPNVVNLNISSQLSNNITLSTMHGCPSDEIEMIGNYLITEKKLHTAIKLNPTLLGKQKLKEILKNSGFETDVPDLAFEHDLKYDEALSIIRNLQQKADENNLQFSIKLTNTLESNNNKEVFPEAEKMMYMSGKPLHPISINLAYKLQNEFDGKLDISFSGGADAFNVTDIINCGLSPVTVCTDLLKPGGYGRLNQYIENISALDYVNLTSENKLINLKQYTENIRNNSDYKKGGFHDPSIKTNRPLGSFDCAHAPCVDTCPTNQGIPDYMYYTSKGDFKKAAKVIRQTNPFPHTTGMVCDHLCQTKCTRINYDSPVLIREIKRFIAENADNNLTVSKIAASNKTENKVAIIGAGPSGLSCAYYLALAGMQVDVYEAKGKSGGMASRAIPSFRLTDEAIDIDIEKIVETGVNIHYNSPINKKEFTKLEKDSNFIYIGTGAQISKPLLIEGNETKGVLDPLTFLFDVKEGKYSGIGCNVIIIGGGNTAMDAARTAYRLVGKTGTVTIVYRRTIKQMPADLGEIKAVIEEGVQIMELTAPLKINSKNGRVTSLSCQKMVLGNKDNSGRATPILVQDSEFEIAADTIIPAIGQDLDIDFASTENLVTDGESYQTKLPNVYIGGDALRGASTAINAIGDGRKAVQEIINNAGIDFNTNQKSNRELQSHNSLMIKKAERVRPQTIIETSLDDRKNFKLVSTTLTAEEAITEASRCLLCDEVCDICTTVCPNLAFHSYEVEPITYNLQNVSVSGFDVNITDGDTFEITQKHQILHIADWCNQCGNCDTFCPSAGAPYLDKPHLYLNKDTWEKDKDGCFLKTENDKSTLLCFRDKKQYSLTKHNDFTLFKSENFILKLENDGLKIIDVEILDTTNFKSDLTIAAEMSLILRGAVSFYGNKENE
ncbi:MAG: putative selenate reductase subunit YgfK [Bacteroidota bacterium]